MCVGEGRKKSSSTVPACGARERSRLHEWSEVPRFGRGCEAHGRGRGVGVRRGTLGEGDGSHLVVVLVVKTVLVFVEGESVIEVLATEALNETFVVIGGEADVCRMVSARTTGRDSGMQTDSVLVGKRVAMF